MQATRSELLARECADWHHLGLIGGALSERLGQRYEREESALSGLIAWLGFVAAFLIGMAILTLIGMMSRSTVVGGILLALTASGLWYGGIRLATDPAQRYPVTGSTLVTIGLAAAYGAMVLLTWRQGATFSAWHIGACLIVTGVLSLATAYAYHLRWPLLLALLCIFHGLGAWHEYVGMGTYIADIQDPQAMAVIAAACVAFGLWHAHTEDGSLARYAGFGRLYVIFGLLYLNSSLWFLTLDFFHETKALVWIAVFTLVCIAQIVLGARLKVGKLTGFGIVFLSIDLYTRFFESFHNHLSMSLILLIAGLSGLLLGALFERRAGATPQ
jgi:hypothetical protein